VSTAITNATKNLATKDDIATAIAGITLPAGVTMDSVVTAIKNFAALNPTLSSADVTAAVKDYMTANPSITSADVSTAVTNATKGLATKADIATAIAGITLPAGITTANVTTAIEDYMSKNPGLSATDVTKAVSAYMTANPGITAADVSASIDAATKGLATKADIDAAIAGIVFPAGLSKADVAAEIKAAMDANPGLSAADVTESITAYMTANPGLTAADVSTAIANGTKNFVTNTQLDVKLGTLTKEAKAQFDSLSQGQKDIVKAQTKMGVDINASINDAARASTEQIANVRTDLTRDITDVQTQFNARVDELMLQGQTYQSATNAALQELGTGVTGLQSSVTDIQEQQKAAALQAKRAANTSNTSKNLTSALSMIAPAAGALGLVDTSTPGFKDIGYKNIGSAKFESILSPFQQMVEENQYAPKQTEQQTQQQPQQVAPVNQELDPQKEQQGSDYFNYGTQNEIDQMLGSNPGTQMLFSKAGGLATPLMAGGGSTRYGRYAGGGLPLVEHSGKARLDFRTGNAVTGPGDGQSDDIPAMLADGEFVFPADVVAALGNGSTKAGSDKLYDMMHSIRAYHRSAKPKDLPPPAKQSPLDYLTKTKARR
jgi:hypothetical protein